MVSVPEESEEEKRARKRAERRAKADRVEQNQEFLTDRTALLLRRFGGRGGSGGAAGGIGSLLARGTGARAGSFSSGLFNR